MGTSRLIGFRSFFEDPRKILYDDVMKRRCVKTVQRYFLKAVSRLKTDLGHREISERLAWAFFQSLRFKKNSWRKEREWRGVARFLRRNDQQIKNSSGKRYVEVDFDPAFDLLKSLSARMLSLKQNRS